MTNQQNSDWREEFDKQFRQGDKAWHPNYELVIDFLSSTIQSEVDKERERILNALRYVVAEDEDGYDTLEEIIKVAGIDNSSPTRATMGNGKEKRI